MDLNEIYSHDPEAARRMKTSDFFLLPDRSYKFRPDSLPIQSTPPALRQELLAKTRKYYRDPK